MPLPKKLPLELVSPQKRNHETTFAGHYELSRKIGSGNFGTAYLVLDIKSAHKTK